MYIGITMYEFDRNTGTLIQDIKGIRSMSRWFNKQMDTLSEDSVLVVVKT